MNINNSRVTMVMGAGAVLDMNFPSTIIKQYFGKNLPY